MGIFSRLKEGLAKTRQNIVAGFDSIFSGHRAINDDFYDELEEVMIMGDMGVRATDEILEELKERVKEDKIKDPVECRQILIDIIKEKINIGENAYDYEEKKSVLLIIGVNGVGKTTSVGKIASSLKSKGRKVILAAADTFRAGAIEQLKIWGQRAGVDVIAQNEGADPGAVIYDAVQAAKARNADVLVADTAGRLHNKKNLMNELDKIDRIIEREYPEAYRENLIVLDATTGQNAISQLKEFKEVTDITGIILTKMDGTAKGGIIVAIQAEFGIPVKYIGVGEKIEDLQKFDSDTFVNALFDVGDTIQDEDIDVSVSDEYEEEFADDNYDESDIPKIYREADEYDRQQAKEAYDEDVDVAEALQKEAPVTEEEPAEVPQYEEPEAAEVSEEEPLPEVPIYEEPSAGRLNEEPVEAEKSDAWDSDEEPLPEGPIYEEPSAEKPEEEPVVAEEPDAWDSDEEPLPEVPIYGEPAAKESEEDSEYGESDEEPEDIEEEPKKRKGIFGLFRRKK